MDRDITASEMVRVLLTFIKKAGNHEKTAQILGVSRSLVSYMVEGKKSIGEDVANALGYERVIVYRKRKE